MPDNMKSTNEAYKSTQRNDGYQPQTNREQRGFQPKPNGNYGYQPVSNSSTPPVPPSSGSNITQLHNTGTSSSNTKTEK